jgi:hypothetical protein
VPAAKGRLSKSGNGIAQGCSAVLRGRHAVAADQLGVEQSFRLQWVAGVVVSSATLAGVKDWPSLPAGPVAIWLTTSGEAAFGIDRVQARRAGTLGAACKGDAPEDRFACRVRSTLRRRYP